MQDPIMAAGTVVFFVLFAFLIFLFVVFLISLFKSKKQYKRYTPKITILIPTYNEQDTITKCLGSLLASRYPRQKIEYIVEKLFYLKGSYSNFENSFLKKGFAKRFSSARGARRGEELRDIHQKSRIPFQKAGQLCSDPNSENLIIV